MLDHRRTSRELEATRPRPYPPAMIVRVIIVNWNSGPWLARSLASLRAHAGPGLAEVVVVDNASSDGSERIPLAPGERLIETRANLGFAKACNIGAAGATTPYLLFFNPDAELREGTLQAALAFMESPEAADVAVCGIRLVGEDGAIQRHISAFPTPATMFRNEQRELGFDHLSSRDVDHVIGAFYLIRRAVFEELGGFDERFFVYLEDIDLSWRVRQAGWRTHYLASAVGFHKGGGTSERVKAERLFYSLRSRLLYAGKNFSRGGALFVLAVTLLVEPFARLARGLLGGRRGEMRQTLRAYRLLLGDLPRILRTAFGGPRSSNG